MTGPGDSDLYYGRDPGYKPVSRVGEVVMNAAVDSRLWKGLSTNDPVPFHTWASVFPGMVTIGKMNKETVSYDPSNETTVRCISCSNGLDRINNPDQYDNYFFTGICRSASVRTIEESTIGPTVDEFFTVWLSPH